MEQFDKAYQRFCAWVVRYVVGFLLLASMMMVTINVMGRYVFRSPILGLYTYVGLMLVPITFFCLAYGWYKRGSFVTVNVLQQRLKGKALWWGQFLVYLAAFTIFGATLLYGVTTATITSFTSGQLVGEMGFLSVAWPWKATMVIGTVLFEIRVFLDLVKMLRTGKPIPFDRA